MFTLLNEFDINSLSFGYEDSGPEFKVEFFDPGSECVVTDCKRKPIFNVKGKKPIFCYKHKIPGMSKIIRSDICLYFNCKRVSSFNFEGKKPRFCSEHREPEMINVVTGTCKYVGCYTAPSFNFENEKPKFCFKHREPEMINLKSKNIKKCSFLNCDNNSDPEPETGYQFCSFHKIR